MFLQKGICLTPHARLHLLSVVVPRCIVFLHMVISCIKVAHMRAAIVWAVLVFSLQSPFLTGL